MTPQEIIDFWFSERAKKLWFNSNPEFDAEILERFEKTWRAAGLGELSEWEKTPAGSLALVITLDQFPLNMYRGKPESFSTEAAARAIADRAIKHGYDTQLTGEEKVFLYMPFMHSESLEDQERAVALFEAAMLQDNVRWARHHRDIVKRFGRFPHRNAILGRPSTEEEVEWLNSKEAFKG